MTEDTDDTESLHADAWTRQRVRRPSFERGLLSRMESTATDLCLRYHQLEYEISLMRTKKAAVLDEVKSLKRTEVEVKQRLRSLVDETPMRIASFLSFIPDTEESVVDCNELEVIVYTLPSVDRELLVPGTQVLLYGIQEQGNFVPTCLIDVLLDDPIAGVSVLDPENRPGVSYADIGGLEQQKMELRELVELPMNHADLMKRLGVDPPRGILLYGPPGCGKTMLVRAVATATSATFIYAVGSEFVKMLSGDGPRKVREVFHLARKRSPAILFIDEIDAVAVKRMENVTGSGEKEIQRILMEFLVQMDGFDRLSNVVIIMATNRPEILDPALMRPGRLDRKIEFPLPNLRERRLIFQAALHGVSVSGDLDIEPIVQSGRQLSGADIQAIIREAAMLAARDSRYQVHNSHLLAAFVKVTESCTEALPHFYH